MINPIEYSDSPFQAYQIVSYFEEVAKCLCISGAVGNFKYKVGAERSSYDPHTLDVIVYIYEMEYHLLENADKVSAAFKKACEKIYGSMCEFTKVSVHVNINQDTCIDRPPRRISVEFKEDKEDNKVIRYSVPAVKEIIHSKSKKKGEVFTVKWVDGTETSVKLMEGDTSDDYVAFMYCVSIRMFGSKGETRKIIKKGKEDFETRVALRSEELQKNRIRRELERKSKDEVPYAGGLRVPALASSSMFKKKGGGDKSCQE